MTTRKEAFIALRDKVRDGEHWHFDETPVPDGFPESWIDAFNGSLDAALALFEDVLPGWSWRKANWPHMPRAIEVIAPVLSIGPDDDCAGFATFTGEADTPARALLLAILEALIAEEE